jgi:metal-responsive CopG/Arc/MetJ family transcriptional regulator
MTVKVMVSFPEGFLREVDRIAGQEHRSRSELVREAIRHYIEMRQRPQKPGDMPQVKRAIAAQNALASLAPGAGQDSTGEVRRLREARR